MRTAKYHDYTVLRIVLFIILVILGLFIYNQFIKAPLEHTAPDNAWITLTPATCTEDGLKCRVCTECGEQFDQQIIPATGHKAGAAVKENEKAHTLTEGGSYDEVKYCTVCKAEASREKVYINGEHTPEIVWSDENVKESTCTEFGTYEHIPTCKVCNEVLTDLMEIKVVDPKGHNYDWKMTYDASTGYAMIGECKDVCDEDGSTVTYTEANGLVVTRDASVSSCCLVRYIGQVKIGTKTYLAYIDFEADKNHTAVYHPDKDSYNPDNPIIKELPDAKVDQRTGKLYYDLSEVLGIVELTDEIYDEYGFARGYFKCTACAEMNCSACKEWYDKFTGETLATNHRFIVNVYNPDYDTYLYPQTNENGLD